MENRAFAFAAICVLAAAVAGCGRARAPAATGDGSGGTCTTCHGGTDDNSGAPPRDIAGHTATNEVTVGAHAAHVRPGPLAAAFDCDACHVKPASVSAPGHLEPSQMIVWGSLATARGSSPSWDRATATCSNVYCHGATMLGGTNPTPSWTKVDGTQATCGSCHGLPPANHPALAAGSSLATCNACHPDTVKGDGAIDLAAGRHVNGKGDGFAGHPSGWMDAASASFHGASARGDVASCQRCHALAEPAKVSAVTCTPCHDGAAVGNFGVNCRSCHGSTANAAPPRDLSGSEVTSARGVGAHQSHVLGTHRFAAPLSCESCHPKPAQVAAAGHMDGSVQVTGYTGDDPALAAAVKDPGWETTGASCSASYCHGASPALGGGAVPFPVWTKVDGSQVFCGSCHGLPPRGHPALAPGSTVATCAACHPGTVTPDGTIDVAGGLHMNGRQDGFAGHPDGWAEGVVHGLAAAQDLTSCFACHTPKKPARISALSCATCHDPMAGGDWTTTCRNCHGSSTSAAPPRDTHGNMATTARGVGAHQSHMKGTHGVAGPLDCVHCHRKPADIFGPGHMNGKVELSGYTGSDPAMAAALSSQGWDEAALTCTNYCHGATLGGGTAMQPVWTRVDGAQAACGSCHGLPPARHMALTPPVTAATCSTCHPATVRPDGTIDVAGGKHVNGTVEIAGFTGHGAGWLVPTDQGFHGQAVVAQGLYGCAACHSPKEPTTNGIRSCATCHDTLAGGADWTTSCAGCHGSSASVAPPKDLHGNTATTFVGVGAHQSHLAGTHGVAAPLDCDSCHPIPSTVLQRPHADGTVDVTGYTGSDPALLAAVTAPGWGTASNSCGTSYCHGATLGGGTAMKPVWTRVDGTQAACGSCHGLPPTHHMTLTAPGTAATCSTCHPATVRPDGSIDVAGGKHLNGRIETDGFAGHGAGWIVPGDPAFHGQAATTQGMNTCFACHSPKEPATNGVPSCASCHDALAGGVDWTTACVGCHGSGGTSAPPKDTHGNTTTTALGVGAHRSHVEATHGLARRFDCDACHQKPAVVFSPGHLDGTTRVTGYTGSDPGLQSVTDPSWNRASATCATSWCHGNYSGTFSFRNTEGDDVTIGYSGTPASPSWTRVDGTQGACGTCHALPPQNGQWHNPFHARGFSPNGSACSLCHPGVKADGSGFVDVALHVDGRVDVTPAWGLDCVACH